MPLPALAAAAMQIGGQAASSLTNQIFARDAEKRQQNYNTRVYEQQRNHALQDWEMQNKYNSPQEVMRRYKEAGLNPNLIYGNGTNAPAAQVRSSQQGSFTPQVQRVESNMIGDSINQYYNVQRQKAELDLTNEQVLQTKANTNLLTWKAITEGQMPDYLRSKRNLTDKQAITEGEKPDLARNQSYLAKESADLKALMRNQSSTLFPLEQSIKQQVLQNLKATLGNINASTTNLNARTSLTGAQEKTENQTRDPKIQKLYADIYNTKMNALLKEYQSATESQKREKIAQEVLNLREKYELIQKDNSYYEIKGTSRFLLDLFKGTRPQQKTFNTYNY